MRKAVALIMVCCIFFSLTVPGFAAGKEKVSIVIDGSEVGFTESSGFPLIDDNDRTLVPLRATLESYGCEVYWDNENRKAIVYRDGVSVVCPIGESYIEINGQRRDIDTSAVIVGGRTYLPIRCVLEAFGAVVGWEQSSLTVTVKRGTADATLHQDTALSRAIAAIDANSSLNQRDAEMIKRAVTEYLSNIEVAEMQITKMCSRLKTLKVEQEAMTDYAGYITTYDGIDYTISINTLGDKAITTDGGYYCVMMHELCHMFSEITITSTWFQEGMTQLFEIDMTDESPLFSGGYDIYYQVVAALCDLLGADIMLEAYLSGGEGLIYAQLDQYAGTTDSEDLFCSEVETMSTTMDGSIYASYANGTYDGLTKDNWDTLYASSAAQIIARLSAAYAGKYGSDIKDDPMMTMHLSIIERCAFFSTSLIFAQPTLSVKEDLCYYDRSQLKFFFIMDDSEHSFSEDGEIVYYRFAA